MTDFTSSEKELAQWLFVQLEGKEPAFPLNKKWLLTAREVQKKIDEAYAEGRNDERTFWQFI